MKQGKAWAAELAGILGESTGSRPVINRAPFNATDFQGEILWWQSHRDPAVMVGVSETDAALLPNFTEILERVWGRGEMVSQGPSDHESGEIYNIQFASGDNVRLFVAQPEAAQTGRNLDMLMDIELPITIRFGSTQMALRDIAGLSAGSVVEFDRGVDEPVEVMVNGHVVARGEAVTVQGSYGVRISEISSRRERLIKSSFAAQGE